MHAAVLAFAKQHIDAHGPYGHVVEFGSLDINGSPRPLLPADVNYLGVNLQAGPGVDLVADAAGLDVPPVDLVLCLEVLEHAPDKAGLIASAARNLRPGGHLVLTAAVDPRAPHSGIDEQPIRPHEFYANADPDEVRSFLDLVGFTVCEFDLATRGDLHLCAERAS
jgi:SAM-dependent methyltransferase